MSGRALSGMLLWEPPLVSAAVLSCFRSYRVLMSKDSGRIIKKQQLSTIKSRKEVFLLGYLLHQKWA
jgi:hypothetical protein